MIMAKKVLLVILDGAADGLIEGKQTTLQAANKPALDFFAEKGFAGLIDNRLGTDKFGPDSGVSTFALFGYDPKDYPGRGYLDALGIGLDPKPDEVCIRANFATVREVPSSMSTVPYNPKTLLQPDFIVLDRRAGREKEGLKEIAESIASISIDGTVVRFHKSVGHRCIVMLRNVLASPHVSDSDPGVAGMKVQEIKPLTNDNAAVHTASVLNRWTREAGRIMKEHPANKFRMNPANMILLRGASMRREIDSFENMFGKKAACVAASPVVRGIARATGMDVIDVPGATGDLNTNLRDKAMAALDALRKHDFVILHILGPDVAAHDRKFDTKRGFIEKIDREVFKRIMEYLDVSSTLLVVTSDHITSIFSGMHESGAFPFAIYGKDVQPNEVRGYDEHSCSRGPVITIDEFMEILISKT
ncbi:MAG: 2,3-bisphosphoglycerate-independent phosphoglycerate mutase [Candidatus Aenigmatarchaeota archaeon]